MLLWKKNIIYSYIFWKICLWLWEIASWFGSRWIWGSHRWVGMDVLGIENQSSVSTKACHEIWNKSSNWKLIGVTLRNAKQDGANSDSFLSRISRTNWGSHQCYAVRCICIWHWEKTARSGICACSFLFQGILPLLAIRNREFNKNWDLWGILTSLVHHSISLIHERADAHPLQSTDAFWQTKPKSSPGGEEIWHSETYSSDTILSETWTGTKPETYRCRLIEVSCFAWIKTPLWGQLVRLWESARSACQNEKFLLIFPVFSS